MRMLFAVLVFALTGCDQPRQNVPAARYQLQVDNLARAWRLDIVTGEMILCGTTKLAGMEVRPSCSRVEIPEYKLP